MNWLLTSLLGMASMLFLIQAGNQVERARRDGVPTDWLRLLLDLAGCALALVVMVTWVRGHTAVRPD